jgi:hypothetical protein
MAKEYVAPKVVDDLKALALDGEVVSLDLTEDAWEYGAPPPGETVYPMKLFLDKDGILQGYEDEKNPKTVYFQFNLICKIVEGEFEGTPIYTRVNTRIWRGKNISTMAGLIVKLGFKIPDKLSPKQQALYMQAALKKEPIVKGEVDWRGAYVYKDPKGEDAYENVFRHYRDFPEDKENPGTRLHVVSVTNKHNGGMSEVRAQTQIGRFYGVKEEVRVAKTQTVVGVTKIAEVPELELASIPTIAKASSVTTPTKHVATEDEDIQLMLAE